MLCKLLWLWGVVDTELQSTGIDLVDVTVGGLIAALVIDHGVALAIAHVVALVVISVNSVSGGIIVSDDDLGSCPDKNEVVAIESAVVSLAGTRRDCDCNAVIHRYG